MRSKGPRLAVLLGFACAIVAGAASASGPPSDAVTLHAVLERVRKEYVEPSRVDPAKMLWAAVQALDREIPEAILDSSPGQDAVALRVAGARGTFPVSAAGSLRGLEKTLAEVLRFVKAHRAPSSKPNAEYAAVNGMLAILDPHSVLLDPSEAKEFRINLASRFSGIGIAFGSDPPGRTSGVPVVTKVFAGGPAEDAGIALCDRIVAVEDRWAAGLDWGELVDLLRGPTGSPVWVTLVRDGTPRDIVATRAVIRVPSVSSRRLEGEVGYVQIERFTKGTAAEVRSALAELKKSGATSWILDLRQNPGGLLSEAVEAASAFVASGPVVTVAGAGGREREVREAKRAPSEALETGPVFVLVGPFTASSAEVFSAALQSRNRAAVLGRTSFGKGSVQVLFDHVDGSILKLTVAHYLPPGGASLQARGITPDVELDPVPVPREGRIRLTSSETLQREVDLGRAFQPRELARPSDISLRYLAATPDAEEEVRIARELLVATRVETRGDMFTRGRAFLEERRSAEDSRVASALEEAGVDWTAGPAREPARLVVRCAQIAPPAADRVPLECDVRNDGAGDAFRVVGRVPFTSFDLAGEEVVVGRVPAGTSRKVKFAGGVAEDPAARVSYVTPVFSGQGGAPAESSPLRIEMPARKAQAEGARTHHLELAVEAPLETASDLLRVKAVARDADGVVDGWVRISNKSADVDRKKVAYVSRPSFGPADRLEIASEVALRPGLNEIGVCARGKEEERCERVFVYRVTP